jgi:hypothetical protein
MIKYDEPVKLHLATRSYNGQESNIRWPRAGFVEAVFIPLHGAYIPPVRICGVLSRTKYAAQPPFSLYNMNVMTCEGILPDLFPDLIWKPIEVAFSKLVDGSLG